NEVDGTIYAFDTHGRATVVARPNAPRGADIGVESLGFAPAGGRTAYLADLGAPGSPTQGTDSLLSLTRSFVAGELVAVTEGGAVTFSVRCRRVCTSGRIAQGPQATHAEGHVAFGHAA